jgi:hypothetical protein
MHPSGYLGYRQPFSVNEYIPPLPMSTEKRMMPLNILDNMDTGRFPVPEMPAEINLPSRE